MTRTIVGLGDLANQYDGFIIDLWGVVHDGVDTYPGALECLARLKGRPVLFLSNAPRRVGPARDSLRLLGVGDELYCGLLTSGEATWLALRDRSDPWFAGLGNRIYHLGPLRDRSSFEGLGLDVATTPAGADFVLNTGPDDHRDGRAIGAFVPELQACLTAGLNMICANPDLEIIRGGERILCAGALAAYYAEQGGHVHSIGKPDPAIYEQALAILSVDRSRVLAIGDSLRTDIRGAERSGIASVWITGGIHAEEIKGGGAAAKAALDLYGLHPVAIMTQLRW